MVHSINNLTFHQVRVGIPQKTAYRSPSNFTEPLRYQPERWLKDAPTKFDADRKDSFEPFMVGPRNCLGKRYVHTFLISRPGHPPLVRSKILLTERVWWKQSGLGRDEPDPVQSDVEFRSCARGGEQGGLVGPEDMAASRAPSPLRHNHPASCLETEHRWRYTCHRP